MARRAVLLVCLAVAAVASPAAAPSAGPAAPAVTAAPTLPHALPPIRHVFVLLLENQSYALTFGAQSPAPYLARTLPARGALLTQYYAIGHASLDNYIALISGQAPNEATQLDCPVFSDFRPSVAAPDAHGQLPGVGCVYPRAVRTLPDQLEAAGLSWKAYMEDMGRNPAREAATCAHAPLGKLDITQVAQRTDQYAARHNPFVYFHSIIDDRARCDARVVSLEHLPQDLASEATTANYVFITPNLCNDGHDAACADGRRGGLVAVNAFLQHWVPLIESSPAFRTAGLLVITFDESDAAGPEGSSACCGEQPLPGARYLPGFNGPGGGRVGAVLLSPFIKPGTIVATPYNHYALLRTTETIFGLPYLGYAANSELRMLGADVFTAYAPGSPAH